MYGPWPQECPRPWARYIELLKRNVEIAALQETRLSDTDTIKEENYTFFWFGKPAERATDPWYRFCCQKLQHRQHPDYNGCQWETIFTGPRYLGLCSELWSIWQGPFLQPTRRSTPNFSWDQPNSFSWPDCIGKFGVRNMNENGQRLLELCCRQNLCITNTMFPGKPHRKQSWCHPRSKSWHQLNFVFVKQRHKQEVRNT